MDENSEFPARVVDSCRHGRRTPRSGLIALLLLMLLLPLPAQIGDGSRTYPAASSERTSNSALILVSPSDPESLANYRILSALSQVSSGAFRLIVKPTPVQDQDGLLLFEAVYSASVEGRATEMLDRTLSAPQPRSKNELIQVAGQLGLNLPRFERDLAHHTFLSAVQADLLAAEALVPNVAGTTFINGVRVNGSWNTQKLEAITATLHTPLPPGSIGAAHELPSFMRAVTRGDHNAFVTINEFADFSCSSCAALAPFLEQLVDSYGGKVKLIFRHFPSPQRKGALALHRIAVHASRLGKFWQVHDMIFSMGYPVEKKLLDGRLQELDVPMAAPAASDTDTYDRIISRDLEEGSRLGVDRTPYLIVDGEHVPDNIALGELKKLVDRHLHLARSTLQVTSPK